MSDPIQTAIEAAIDKALAKHIPEIVEKLKAVRPEPEDRFVPIREAAQMLGVHFNSVCRLERQGTLPPRERMGKRTGYRLSTIKKILDRLGD